MTIEQLENDYWVEPPEGSTKLVMKIHSLRRKPLDDLEIEDLRLLFGQNVGVEILIPKAIEILENNLMAEGDYYEGDLLKNVLSSDKKYWKLDQRDKLLKLVDANTHLISEAYITDEIKDEIFQSYEKFKD